MTLIERRKEFDRSEAKIYDSAILTFSGVEGYDVYNCSVPFRHNGKRYIFGRVEKRNEWARSRTMLFEEVSPDHFCRVNNSMIYQTEDPNIAVIHGELVLGGIFVMYASVNMGSFYNLFYHGTDLEDMYYFATGPVNMKDIRLVELPDHRIGVFSRPRNEEIIRKFGSESQIGFTVINDISELSGDVIQNAPYIPGIFGDGEWGGCNQAYSLESGKIGVIGHKSYQTGKPGIEGLSTYLCLAFVFDPETHSVLEEKIIATSKSFPAHDAKRPHVADCAFTSGIVPREDGKVDLYSGLGDSTEGRITIDNPFEKYGKILTPLQF